MTTHAYVRYIEDNEQAVVAIQNIKDFRPRGPEDFNDKAKYNVKWGSDDEYYKARILLLGGKLACKLLCHLSVSQVRLSECMIEVRET